MTLIECDICSVPTNVAHTRTLVVDVLTKHGTLHKGEIVQLCNVCVSAHGFMLGGEYNHRRYGDDYTSSNGRCKVGD